MCANKSNTIRFGSALGIPPMIMTIDPKNVNHVLKGECCHYWRNSVLFFFI